ncbi:PAS domain-containing sensor histidine kinase [Marinobacter zhejiangensis]|uniref:histidine kinase n=1 Tax=Marinobacter zhejiangensis TaxID=488535 RepID=A0A1I4PGM5_9GAMM|nr:PAS domain-containing sensor histidine kinase [Marinobacter zhejiangensis]SFM26874.1 PAS domain S-box-containing protein [Marinobacter zhejiangensis]
MAGGALNSKVFEYREIFEYANDAMIIHCAETGDVIEVNKMACQLYGCGRDNLIGCKVGDLARGNESYNHEKAVEVIRKAYFENTLLTFEWEIVRPDGTFRPVECNLKRLGGKTSGLVLAMARDISDRKEAEQQLRAKNKYFKRLLSVSSDGIALINSDGIVEFVSESVKSITGRPASLIKGRLIFDFIHPSDTPGLKNVLRAMIENSDKSFFSGTISFRLRHVNGGWRNHEANYKNFLGSKNFNYVIINFRDVTDRLKREEEYRQRDQDLNHLARLSLAGEVSAAIAHELNQPLCAAVNYFAGCRNRLNREEYSRKDVLWGMEMAQKELERAGKVVAVVRNFTKNRQQSPRSVSVREVVESAYEIIKVQIQNSLARCNIDIICDVKVFCDVILIQQVISNLVANSLDSMSDNENSEKVLSISVCCLTDAAVEISVLDQGGGVPEYLKEDHFDKSFYTTKEGGLGLGLSLCRKIVKSHRGTLKIGDRQDGVRGTKASFVLPILRDAEKNK